MPDMTPDDSIQPTRSFLGTIKIIFGSFVSWVLLPLIMIFVLHSFVFQAYHVEGGSMLQTLHNRDYLIVSKVGDTLAQVQHMFNRDITYVPSRGQIIVFHYPVSPEEIFVKRVVALPGERVVVKDGFVTVFTAARPNGFNPDTSYEPAGTKTLEDTDVTVTPKHVFVMGDNRTPGGSFDSREWGLLPSENIIGNAVIRLLPLNQAKIF